MRKLNAMLTPFNLIRGNVMNEFFEKLAGNRGVALFTQFVSLGVMLLASHVSFAHEELDKVKKELSKEAYVEVTTALDVREQISKLPLADKKRAEAAVKVGATYLKVYLHGVASCDPNEPNWHGYMDGLTATDDGWDWDNNFCGGATGFFNQHVEPLACSPVSLVALQLKGGSVVLEYRIVRLGGVTMDKIGPLEFKPQGAGDVMRFRVSINTNNRIYDIDPRGDPAEIGYVGIIEMARKGEKKLNLHGAAFPEEMKARYGLFKQLMQQAEQQAAQVCK